jgi:hypothetical protein
MNVHYHPFVFEKHDSALSHYQNNLRAEEIALKIPVRSKQKARIVREDLGLASFYELSNIRIFCWVNLIKTFKQTH